MSCYTRRCGEEKDRYRGWQSNRCGLAVCRVGYDGHAWWKRGGLLVFWIGLSLLTYLGAIGHAQEGGLVAPPRLPQLPGPPQPRPPTPPPIPRYVLPPLPPLSPREQERLPQPRILLRQIVVTGNTVFSEEEIAAVTEGYLNREVTSEELEALRLALTQLYIDRGYINSGAILPDQTVQQGVVRFQIIEGELSDVMVTNNRWFRPGYLRQRLALGVKTPLNIGILQERLQQLQQDDRIARLQAELRPGVRLGESELHVRVEETLPFTLALEFNNYRTPSVGAERLLLNVAHRNLTGYGDVLSLTSEVTADPSDPANWQLDASYTLPLSPWNTTGSLRYRHTDSTIVEEPFASDPFNFESSSEIFTVAFRHPLYRTLRREFALALTGEYLKSQSETSLPPDFLPVLFPGTDDGEARITALRLTAEWIERTANQVIAMRSRFSVGVDILDATINHRSDLPTAEFFAWLGQFQWGRRLPIRDIQLLLRLDVQLSTEPLFPLEQIAIGGRFSVRGYRENQLVRDNGLLTSLEVRIPLMQNQPWAEIVQVVPFVDMGWGENRNRETPSPKTLVSVGLGVRWAARWQMVVPVRTQFEVFWGYKLKDVDNPGGDLQDKGLHLQFVLAAF